MDYEAAAQERYQEMCRIVGDVVFADLDPPFPDSFCILS